jgi:hypothetical protein
MPSYQKDVWNQTKQQDPNEYANALAGTQEYAKNLSKGFGGGAPISPVSYAQQSEGQRKFDQGDVARRQQASQFQQQYGAGIDARRTGIADQVTALLNKDRAFGNQMQDSQYQTNRADDLEKSQINEDYKNKLKTNDFTAYKNGSDRADAMSAAYAKGYAEMDILNSATEGKLKIMDIQNYFQDLINDMKNSFSTWKNDQDISSMRTKETFERMSKNTAAIVDGLTGVGVAGIKKYNQ